MEQKNSYIKKGRDKIEDLEGRSWYRELGTLTELDIYHDDHGWKNVSGTMDFGGTGQGFTFIIDSYNKLLEKRIGHEVGAEFICRLMNLFGTSFNNIGGLVYALYETPDQYGGGPIKGLMHPTTDKYLIFHDVVEDMKKYELLKED
jgi:hypothetical protein